MLTLLHPSLIAPTAHALYSVPSVLTPSKVLHRSVHHLLVILRFGQIRRNHEHIRAPQLAAPLRVLLQQVLPARRQHQVRPPPRVLERQVLPDSRAGPGDDHRPPVHVHLLLDERLVQQPERPEPGDQGDESEDPPGEERQVEQHVQ